MIVTVRSLWEGTVFSNLYLSVCLCPQGEVWSQVNKFEQVHVVVGGCICVAHKSIGQWAVGLQLKGFLVIYDPTCDNSHVKMLRKKPEEGTK